MSTPTTLPSLAIAPLRAAYRSGTLSPSSLVELLLAQLAVDDPAWIYRVPDAALRARARELEALDASGLPLYGLPFAVKDNIDIAGMLTTAACPAFAYTATESAFVVQRLLDAGAMLIGKTNLDQFATGLVGTRSPYGAVPNAFDARYISGGSSSGSASVVARGLVSFALGTDTAGSGRVPAGFNNLVGLKPTRGLLSTRGVVPACRTLDCVSIFALSADDAGAVLSVAAKFDAADPYARTAGSDGAAIQRIGVPVAPEFFGDDEQARCFAAAQTRARDLGLTLKPIDFTPLMQAAALLYDGPWVAERHAAIRAFFDAQPDAVDPVVRSVIGKASAYSASDAFAAQYRLAELKRACERIFESVDALLVPTAPSIYTIEQVRAEPIALNSRLGTYTNFVNLLDLSALAVPDALRADGLPFGITLIAPAWSEAALLDLGARWQQYGALPLGATPHALPPGADQKTVATDHRIRIAVVGAHLSGMPLNKQLAERNAVRIAETTTMPSYRLYALANTTPPKPGLRRVSHGGAGESVGLVGESGCGKSTLVRLLARLLDATEGSIQFHPHDQQDGIDLAAVPAAKFARHAQRSAVQMVFQDPTDSLNPRFTARQAIAEPLRLLKNMNAAQADARVDTVATQVGLPLELLSRFPHQLSGGQKARVGIARALAVQPKLLILDEPTSALDVSVQAVVLQLLDQLRRELGLSYLFVSHDLNVVRLLTDRVLVMYLGKVVESGPVNEVLLRPQHPYTQALVAAIPGRVWKEQHVRLSGEVRSPIDPPATVCRFYGRCPAGTDRCAREMPVLRETGAQHLVACHFA